MKNFFLDYIMGLWMMSSMILFLASCKSDQAQAMTGEMDTTPLYVAKQIIPGAENVAEYYSFLEGKKVGLVVNQTSMVQDVHLVDTLLNLGVNILRIFAPEHGFRGQSDAGEKINSTIDKKSGLPIFSLYGKHKKPTKESLKDIDIMVFDIQDVGVRFYTYISTLHYVMEACAENGIPLIVLDRPNPNAHYVDGPIMQDNWKSFVGMHPVPIVYGMTIGEYAMMINGEKWLQNGSKCNLKVIPCKNYTHDSFYELPVKPSPNLPNIRSVLLYPSLCLFEGTTVSIGRGTNKQFQVIGHPQYPEKDFYFVPQPNQGAKNPKHKGEKCYGIDLSNNTIGSIRDLKKLNLSYLIDFYQKITTSGKPFFNENNFFEKLAGTSVLRKQLIDGKSKDEIRQSWKKGLSAFKKIRAKYLIYN